MEFNNDVRRKKFIQFMDYIESSEDDEYFSDSTKTSNSKSIKIESLFELKKLSSGIEGIVYKATANKKYKREEKNVIVVKKIDLAELKETKDLDRLTAKATPESIYKLYQSESAFRNPALIEIISNTLLNQLVLQNICPNYVLNYYWDLTIDKSDSSKRSKRYINIYNEYINYSDFSSWAESKHTNKYWFNALFQIMIGLAAMKRYFNLLHTDFHTGNILVQKVKPGGYWLYTINGNNYYLPNLGFVFLISDFGFGWIPNKMQIDWYYKSRLQYINKSGQNFYDVYYFFDAIFTDPEFIIPEKFENFVSKIFKIEEIEYVYSTEYYKLKVKKKKSDWIRYRKRLEKHPNIPIDYIGTNKTLIDKIEEMFYHSHGKANQFFNYGNRDLIKPNEKEIERYSLDKNFNKSKIPSNFKQLVNLQFSI